MQRNLQSPADETATFATITRCARPVEEYVRQAAELSGARGETPIRPVDTFLLHQLTAMLPEPPVVIDLAADVTGGASAALWSSHSSLRAAAAPRREAGAEWRRRFAAFAGRNLNGTPVDLDGLSLAGPDGWSALADAVAAPGPAVVLVHGAEPELLGLLARIIAAVPRAIIAVLGIGPVGGDRALAGLEDFRRTHPGYRLRALRELSPFLAGSDLAVLHPAGDPSAPDAMERIAHAFDGNFQFINLLQIAAEAATADVSAPAPAVKARPAEQDYPRLVERVRAAVREAVPKGASVLVVSKGDDELLKVDGRRAAHFPQAANGAYAGHHPADDDAAVAQLEALRAGGARYLVLPATSTWWLEHYEGFRRHLEETAAVRVCRPETCIVFELAAAPKPSAGKARRRARIRRRGKTSGSRKS